MTLLVAQPLSAKAFAPYGRVIEAPAQPRSAARRLINDGHAERFDLIDDLLLDRAHGRPMLAVFRTVARRFPLELRAMERHALGSQSFLPLGQRRFVVVVAPAGDAPRPDALRAFITDGTQGVWLAPGTWHHALLAVDAGDFAVIERAGAEGEAVDCDIHTLGDSLHLTLG